MSRPSLKKLIVVAAAATAVSGASYGIVGATSGSTSTTANPPAAGGPRFGASSNARSGPATGGAAGTVGSRTTSGFTLATSAGQPVTVDEKSTTAYNNGKRSIPASAIATGESVLVLGTTSGTTITATQVLVQPAHNAAAEGSTAAQVVPFQQGAPSPAKQVGQVPAGYSEGSGTIVSGTVANQATEAALVAYPGGVVDRVVKIGNGEYEVHNIGVNWPHHIFVNRAFTVVGAD
jgi:hypothetical protein